jgi:hypothetical protein
VEVEVGRAGLADLVGDGLAPAQALMALGVVVQHVDEQRQRRDVRRGLQRLQALGLGPRGVAQRGQGGAQVLRVMRPSAQAWAISGRGGKTCTPASTASRAATWRTGRPMRAQCGLTAMAWSSGQAGAKLRQAWAQAASTAPSRAAGVGTVCGWSWPSRRQGGRAARGARLGWCMGSSVCRVGGWEAQAADAEAGAEDRCAGQAAAVPAQAGAAQRPARAGRPGG